MEPYWSQRSGNRSWDPHRSYSPPWRAVSPPTLEIDYINAKVIWRLQVEEYSQLWEGQWIERDVDFLGLWLQLSFCLKTRALRDFPQGRTEFNIKSPWADVELRKSRSSNELVIQKGSMNGWHPRDLAAWFERGSEVVVLDFQILKKDGVSVADAFPCISKFQHMALEEQRLTEQLAEETRQKAQAREEGQRLTQQLAEETGQKAQAREEGQRLTEQLAEETREKAQAREEGQRLTEQLGEETTRRQAAEERAQAAEAEVTRLSTLINAGSREAAEWECRLIRSVVKIQSAWRRYVKRQRTHRERAEKDWRLKQAKFQPQTPYTAILALDSLEQFLTDKKIKFLQKAESQLEIAPGSRYRIIAVVGLFDKGKTWLLNKLFDTNLSSGKLCTTQGLSFLWFEKKRMLVIDSAGVQSTVSYRKKAVDAIHDAETTESLMFEMISRISHRIMFVVNDLTWFEQKYVDMLHRKYVSAKKNKELIVVHNLRNTSDVAEAKEIFSRQVPLCYDGESSHLGDLIFTAYHGEGVPSVHHVGLCHEFSEAGDTFNDKNRAHLLACLELGDKLGTANSLTDLLSQELVRLLPKFVNVENAEPEAFGPPSSIDVKFEAAEDKAQTNGEDSFYTTGTFCMILSQKNARVTTKTRGVISPLGEIIAHDVSFDPIVNVYDRTLDTGEVQREISIVCDGVTSDQVVWEELANGLEVTIDKKPFIDETAVRQVEPIRQHHGVFKRTFLFDQMEGHFEFRKDQCTLENGMLTLVLKKAFQPRKGGLGKAPQAPQGYGPGPGAAPAPSESSFSMVTMTKTEPGEAHERLSGA